MGDIRIVSNTTAHLIPDKAQPHSNNDNLMLLVRHLHDDGILDCSVISTQNNHLKVLRQDDNEFLNLLKEDYYDPFTSNTFFEVHGTCNSWMLLTCFANPYDFLWNPTTGKTIGLPHFSLAGPTISDHWVYGLWFDPAGDTCKVLRSRVVDKYESNQELYVELFSFASDSCERIPCPYDACIEPQQDPSLYINGFYYWPASGCILSFDFAEERFGSLIPSPRSDKFPHARLSNDTVYIVEYESSLAAVVFEYGELVVNNKVTSIIPAAERDPFFFEIWVWKEASTWSCEVKGEIHDYVHRVLGLYKNCKLLLEGSYGDLLAYDLDTRILENLGIRDKNMGLMQVFPYVANAESSFKYSSRNLSTTCTVAGIPATLGEVTRVLKRDDSLMLMVQCVLDWTRIYSVISMEKNSFKVLHQGDDDDNGRLLPNLSLLKAKNYDPICMNAKYHVVASCNTWMLWTYTEIPTDPDVLLWDPKTDVLVALPFFKAEPRMPHPAFACPLVYGIGFDPCAPGDYKVVRIRVFEDFRSKDEAHAELFSLETWKQIPYPHYLERKLYQYRSLFIDGIYYWMAEHLTNGDVAIISFDFAKEEFPPALIPLPSGDVCIAEFRGLLAAIVSDYHGYEERSMNIDCPRQQKKTSAPFIFEIWVWKNDIWSHVSTYKLYPPTTIFVSVIGLYKNDKVFLQDCEGYLWLGDCEKLEMEYLGIRDDTWTLRIFPYV